MRVREYKSTPAGGAAEPALVERAGEPEQMEPALEARPANTKRSAEATAKQTTKERVGRYCKCV